MKLTADGTVSQNREHARKAAMALLKMAKVTSDPAIAAGLVEAAADLKELAGEQPVTLAPETPPGERVSNASRVSHHGSVAPPVKS